MTDHSRDVAIVAVSQTPAYEAFAGPEPVLIMRCVNDLLRPRPDLERHDIDFTLAGSCDYLSGAPFAFVQNIDGVGAWPPVYESHVEMDGAWALFEAWIRLQLGDIDVALVIGSGRSSPGNNREIFALQGDPYVMSRTPRPRSRLPGRHPGPGPARCQPGHRGRLRRRGRTQLEGRRRQPQRHGPAVRHHRPRCWASPTTPLPLPFPRRGARWATASPPPLLGGGRRPGPRAVRSSRVDPGDRASHRVPSPRLPGPDRLALDPIGGREGRWSWEVRCGRAHGDPQPRGDHPAPGAGTGRRHRGQPVGGAAGRPSGDGHRSGPGHRRPGQPDLRRLARPSTGYTWLMRRAAHASSRT